MTGTTAAASRLLKRWDDEAVVYDTDSGDTHYLAPLTFAFYEICREHPGHTSEQLVAELAARLGTDATASFLAQADEALSSLRKIGLLKPA